MAIVPGGSMESDLQLYMQDPCFATVCAVQLLLVLPIMCTGNLFVSDCFAVPCPDCRVPLKDCIVCQAYLKVYGRDFLKYRFEREPHHRTTSTPAFRSFASEPIKLRARLPTDNLLNESRAYSEPIPRSRRIFPRDVDQYGSYLESSSHGINDRMKSLTKGHVTTSPIVSTDNSHLCQ